MSGATAEAVAHFDQALSEFNLYRGDPVGTIDRALAAAPKFVMAHVLKAHLFAMATEPAAAVEASAIVASARGLTMDERERSHLRPDHRDWRLSAAALALDFHNAAIRTALLASVRASWTSTAPNARDLRIASRECSRGGRRRRQVSASCSACTRSASRSAATTPGPKTSAGRLWTPSRSIAGRITPSPT